MARARSIKPSFFTSEQVASCPPLDRLVFIGLWTLSDREGKLLDRPRKIAAELLPYEAGYDLDAALQHLAAAGLILRYEVDGTRYIKVLEFKKHQHPHPKEIASEIPEPRPGAAEPRQGETQHAPGRGKVLPSRAGSSGSSGSSGDGIPEPRPGAAEPRPPTAVVVAQEKLPSKAERLAELYPATQAVLESLTAEGIPVDHAAEAPTRTKVEQLVARLPLAAAVAAIRAGYALKGKLFVGWYIDELTAALRDLDSPKPPPLPVLDLAWIDQLPEPQRAEASAKWGEAQAMAKHAAWPGKEAQVLADACEHLRQQFTKSARTEAIA